jgi:L-lactate dehydrogenase complex protein LldE
MHLLADQGITAAFPAEQTCCGAPAHHQGWREEAITLAKRWIEIFEPYEAIVAPSATCVAMVRQEYPRLLAGEPNWHDRALALAARTYELSQFLVDVLGVTSLDARFAGRLTYHPACQLLRFLQVDRQPRALLEAVTEAELVPLPDADSCCGFGGAFSVQMPRISTAMGQRKARAIERCEADVVVTCETGCLLQIDSLLHQRQSTCRAVHLAELLAGQVEAPSQD